MFFGFGMMSLMVISAIIFITMYCLWAYQDVDTNTKNAYLGTAIAFSIIFVFIGIVLVVGVGRGSIREHHIRALRHGYRRAAVGYSKSPSIGKKVAVYESNG